MTPKRPERLSVVRSLAILLLLTGATNASVSAQVAGSDSVALRVAAVGDIMMGTEGRLPEDGGVSLFAAARKYLRQGDVVFGNHEGALTDRGQPTKVSASGKSYCFRTPSSYGRFLREAGFNMMSVANNHCNDYGPEGFQQTLETLTLNGIAWSGPPGTVAVRTLNGLRVTLIAFHASSHSNWLNDIPAARNMVQESAGKSDIVIVSFHGGAEGEKAVHVPKRRETFYGENRGDVFKFSHAVIEAGADLVLGHGPHVPRAMEVYRGHLIAYSLGNFCTGKGINVKGYTGYAPLLIADLDRQGRLVGGKIISFIQTYGQAPKPDPQKRAAWLIYKLGQEDFPRTNAVTNDGRLVQPGG